MGTGCSARRHRGIRLRAALVAAFTRYNIYIFETILPFVHREPRLSPPSYAVRMARFRLICVSTNSPNTLSAWRSANSLIKPSPTPYVSRSRLFNDHVMIAQT